MATYKLVCSFCKDKSGSREPDETIVSNAKGKVHICSDCLSQCYGVLAERLEKVKEDEKLLSDAVKSIKGEKK